MSTVKKQFGRKKVTAVDETENKKIDRAKVKKLCKLPFKSTQ